jgi:hypothetical protein
MGINSTGKLRRSAHVGNRFKMEHIMLAKKRTRPLKRVYTKLIEVLKY